MSNNFERVLFYSCLLQKKKELDLLLACKILFGLLRAKLVI